MDPNAVEIRPIRQADLPFALAMLSAAFQDDPGAMIIEPDPARRPAATRALFGPVVRWAMGFGRVVVAAAPDGRIVGIASFVPPGHDTPTEAELEAAGQPEAVAEVPDAAARMELMVDFLEAQHGRAIHGPHWRLEFYGVDPELQGTGIGGRLIATGHDAADAARQRIWLETFTARNVAFYERRGYRVVIEGSVPNTSFTLWGMVRDPRPR